jgi:hypothetical protein
MSPLCLYALALPEGMGATDARGGGIGDEPVRAVVLGPVAALVGEGIPSPPEPTADALRAWDRVVRRQAASTRALLPARFGSWFPNEQRLAEAIGERQRELQDALAEVSGREQMTLRVYEAAGPVDATAAVRDETPDVAAPHAEAPTDAGPGTRYLEERRRKQELTRRLPALDALRTALAPFVRAERIEPHDAPPLLASVYHLIDRGQSDAYAEAAAAAPLVGARLSLSGPWPAYAFAPGAWGSP